MATHTLGKLTAIRAIQLIDSMANTKDCRGAFFQNKRRDYRDLKWDYLDPVVARRISRKLSRLAIKHHFEVIRPRLGYSPADPGHGQIRLAVKLDFSMTAAHPRPKKKPRPKLSTREAWDKDIAYLRVITKALRFGRPHHRHALSEILRTARGWQMHL